MNSRSRRRILGIGVGLIMLSASQLTSALASDCPAITVAADQGISGIYPQQLELVEFESAASCKLAFQENPNIAALNGQINGNPTLKPLTERLPAEPLVVLPYSEIGKYGDVLHFLSNATESGTSDGLSLRHVNLLRYSDNLETIVPNIAKSWEWNDDYTELTFYLREGHKWSDGQPFTAADVEFWFNDLVLDPNIYENTPSLWVWDGKPAKVVAVDDTTVKFILPISVPNLVNRFAVSFIQPFQPKHFLGQYHIKYNPDADKLAKDEGFDSWVDMINLYYGRSDWKDVPSPLMKGGADNVVPTLESHVLVAESAEGRRLVANPFFHMVDTAGNQLPYIDVMDEAFIPESEVRNLKIVNGGVDYKGQNIFLTDYPLYKENEESGRYTAYLTPTLGDQVYYSFNTTAKDPVLREIFNDVRFRQAMSLAINRAEVNELVYLGQGEERQATPAEPETATFITDEHMKAYSEYNPDRARELLEDMGLKDSDGDGVRELPNGEPFVLSTFYANQGGPAKNHELVRDYWSDVGVKINMREISSDEYRSKAGSNDLLLTSWLYGYRSATVISQEPFIFYPPFGDRWQPGTGFEWAAWLESGGTSGSEPPADAKRLKELAQQFILVPYGSDESNRIGKEIADIHLKNLWFIGLVGKLSQPIVASNRLGNFHPFKAATYDFYWAYPYRPQQWFIKSDG